MITIQIASSLQVRSSTFWLSFTSLLSCCLRYVRKIIHGAVSNRKDNHKCKSPAVYSTTFSTRTKLVRRIAKGIRIRQLNQFVKSRNARIHSFPGANSKQLLHYLDVNLDNKTDTIILHIGVNDLLQDISLDNFNKFMKNLEYMVQKCRSFGVKRVFFSGISKFM